MGFKVTVKWVKEICKKRVEGIGLTWEKAVAIKCDAVFDAYKIKMLQKWKKTNTNQASQ